MLPRPKSCTASGGQHSHAAPGCTLALERPSSCGKGASTARSRIRSRDQIRRLRVGCWMGVGGDGCQVWEQELKSREAQNPCCALGWSAEG